MRKGLQVGLPEQGYWAELRYFPILLLGSGQCQRWVQWHAHLPCAAKPDVCYWHIADSLNDLAACPLWGVKRTPFHAAEHVR
jgi:hypothetical protein